MSSTVGMHIPLSGNWVPACSIQALKPTDEEWQDAQTPSVICQTVNVALKNLEDFNIERIALVQNHELPIPENEGDTVELTRAPVEHELAGQRTRLHKDAEMDLQLRAAMHLLRWYVMLLNRLTYFVAGNCESVAPRSCLFGRFFLKPLLMSFEFLFVYESELLKF